MNQAVNLAMTCEALNAAHAQTLRELQQTKAERDDLKAQLAEAKRAKRSRSTRGG